MHSEPSSKRQQLLKLLTVYEYDHLRKIRLGSKHDGGYVIADLPIEYDALFSYGIGQNSAFEADWVTSYNRNGFLFDHTIKKVNTDNQYLHFVKQGLGPIKTINLETLSNHVNAYSENFTNKLFLKLDIEESEWEVLKSLDSDTIERFAQLVIEFHYLNSNTVPLQSKIQVFTKLNQKFLLVHAHANNYSHMIKDNGYYPNVLELTYVRKDLISENVRENTLPLPSELDSPNYKYLEDHDLNNYPFVQ